MSLVLEALQKQEAAGDAAAAVSLAKTASQRRRHRLWMALFVIAMAANAVLLAWVFGPSMLRAPPTTDAAEAQPARADTAAAHNEAAPPAPATPVERTAPARRPAPAPRRVSLRNLPEDARQRFPGIAFSTHIYAEDSDLRAIVANGQRLQEGQRVRGLEIVEINEGGVVLAFERYLVELPIAMDWDAP